MKAEVRRQLKTNELLEALARLRELKDPRNLAWLVVLGVLVLLVVGWYGWRFSRQRALERTTQRLREVQIALETADEIRLAGAQNELQEIIREAVNPDLTATARLLLARCYYDRGMRHAEQRPDAFEQAARLLEEIRADAEARPSLHAAATYLLASTCESLRQIDRAKELWESLTQDPRFEGTPYKDLAGSRLADIDALRARVAFAPGNPPVPEPPATATAPSTGPAPPIIRKLTPEEVKALEEARRQAEAAGSQEQPLAPGRPAESQPAEPPPPAPPGRSDEQSP